MRFFKRKECVIICSSEKDVVTLQMENGKTHPNPPQGRELVDRKLNRYTFATGPFQVRSLQVAKMVLQAVEQSNGNTITNKFHY